MKSLDIPHRSTPRTKNRILAAGGAVIKTNVMMKTFNGGDHDKNIGNNGSDEEDINEECDEESQSCDINVSSTDDSNDGDGNDNCSGQSSDD